MSKSCDKSAACWSVLCDGDREQSDRRSTEPKSSILLRLKQQSLPPSNRTKTHGLIQEAIFILVWPTFLSFK